MILDIKDVSWPGWETVQLLGRGSYGGVFEIKRTVLNNEESAALKVISIPQSETEIDELISEGLDNESITRTFENQLHNIINEYSMMRKLSGCSNVVHSDDVKYVAKENGIGWDIFIKMELLTPLTKALPAEIPEETVIRIGKDMCAALSHCEHYNIVHRDIKPQNMFLTDTGVCKLGDFGIAKTMERTMGGTRIGTFKYMAPEVYHGQDYGKRSDIYSLGLVLYWLLNQRRMPFVPLPPAQLLGGMDGDAANRRISGEPFPEPVGGSAELKKIVMKACAFHPNDRYQTAQQMLEALENIGKRPIVPPVPTPPAQPARSVPPVHPTAAPSTAAPARPSVQEKKKSGKEWLIALLIFLVLSAVGLTVVFLLNQSDREEDEADRKPSSQQQTEPEEVPSSPTEEAATPDDAEPSEPDETDPEAPTTARVPDVCGMKLADAQAKLDKAGFKQIVAEPIFDETAAPGTIVRLSEEEGDLISSEKTITLYVSWGPDPSLTQPEETEPDNTPAYDYQNNHLIAASGAVAAVKADGTALISSTHCGNPSGWKNVVSIAIGFDHTVALLDDGTVEVGGQNGDYCTDPRLWTDIVAVAAGNKFTVGLKRDGTVVTAGENTMGRGNVGNWTDIVAIAASDIATVGLKKDGTIVVATDYNFGNTSFWTCIVAVDVSNSHIVGIQDDGTVIASSLFNTNGECNVSDWKDIVAISAGSGHTVGLTKDGTVVAAGKDGNAALDVSNWKDVTAIAAGNSFTVGIRQDGTLVYAGSTNLFVDDALGWTNLATN